MDRVAIIAAALVHSVETGRSALVVLPPLVDVQAAALEVQGRLAPEVAARAIYDPRLGRFDIEGADGAGRGPAVRLVSAVMARRALVGFDGVAFIAFDRRLDYPPADALEVAALARACNRRFPADSLPQGAA